MHNPLRSEAEMFRLVVVIGVGAAAVVALTLLTEPVYGVVLAAALAGVGVGILWQQARGNEPEKVRVPRADDSSHRILVVANETVRGRSLLGEIENRCKGLSCEILVVTPALPGSKLAYWASDTDGAVEQARERLAESVQAIGELGLPARGDVGDADPNVAMTDALRSFPADELIIATHPPERSKWLERGVVERAREEVEIPLTHVVVDLASEGAAV